MGCLNVVLVATWTNATASGFPWLFIVFYFCIAESSFSNISSVSKLFHQDRMCCNFTFSAENILFFRRCGSEGFAEDRHGDRVGASQFHLVKHKASSPYKHFHVTDNFKIKTSLTPAKMPCTLNNLCIPLMCVTFSYPRLLKESQQRSAEHFPVLENKQATENKNNFFFLNWTEWTAIFFRLDQKIQTLQI